MKILNKSGIVIYELEGDSLSEANLYGANLSWANLRGANLSWANLRGANLRQANLYGANLSWANLYRANLSEANLSGANLYRANLSEANLSGANLSEANLIVIYASRHPIYSQISGVTIGCHCHPLAWWLENYEKCGEENGYTESEISEYGRLLKALPEYKS